MITNDEQIRYKRQLILPGFGIVGQEKLKNSKVFVAGAGGLGAPVCYYLAAAGVGKLVIADCDRVDLSNLNRQILHGTNDIGTSKADSAFQTLSSLNPEIEIETHTIFIEDNNLENVAEDADILLDCLDNIKIRQVLNRFSITKNIPIMHAGIDAWNGQLTFLNPPETACVNCLFESALDTNEAKPVLGAFAGVIGSMQALETIKFLVNGDSELKNILLHFDGLNAEWTKIPIQKNENCKVCGK